MPPIHNEDGGNPTSKKRRRVGFLLTYGLALVILGFVLRGSTASATRPKDDSPPHIVVMLIDDMGWYNAPWNGNAEIKARMPCLTHLATKQGVLLDRHYSYKYCSPARSALLSGRLPIHVTQNNKNNLVTNPGGADLRMTLLPEALKELDQNYTTALIGKWHVGARSTANLPRARGFDYHFGFLKGGEDHFTQINLDSNNTNFVDLWQQDQPAYGQNGTYSTYMYADKAVQVIEQHAVSQQAAPKPLFMYLAWQCMHGPLEAPPAYILPVENDAPPKPGQHGGPRATMNAMGAILDEGVRNVTRALKQAGMWKNTLLIVSSDNGGWLQRNFGGNNYPLRGGKVTDFEGGVRTAAFVSGGYLQQQAPHLIGTRSSLLMHLTDWYATILGIAAGGDKRAIQRMWQREEQQNHDQDSTQIPPVDSLNVWKALIDPHQIDNITAVRTEIPLSFCSPEAECDWPGGTGDAALIQWPWKIINGSQAGLGLWQSPQFPNVSLPPIPMPGPDVGCPRGCLFHLEQDPLERNDVKDKFPFVFGKLYARLIEVGHGVYQTNYDGNAKKCLPVMEAYKRDKGFLAPRCTVDDDDDGDDNKLDEHDAVVAVS